MTVEEHLTLSEPPAHPESQPHSIHANRTAEEAASAFTKRLYRITAITLGAVGVTAVICLADAIFKFVSAGVPIVLLLAAILFAFIWNKPAKRKNYQDLQEILYCDADPKKMLATCKILLDKFMQPDDQMNFKLLCGQCFALLNDGERALRYAKTAEDSQASPGSKLTMLNIRSMVYANQNDAKMLEKTREEIVALVGEERGLTGADRFELAEIDFALATINKDWSKAIETLELLEEPERNPKASKKNFLLHVLNTYRRGRVAAGIGEMRDAKNYFAYVAEHGCTTDFARLSRNWINNHPNA